MKCDIHHHLGKFHKALGNRNFNFQNSLRQLEVLLLNEVMIGIPVGGQTVSVTITRDAWLEHCSELIHGVRLCMHNACKQASVKPKNIDTCITLGPMLRMNDLKSRLFEKLPEDMKHYSIERADAARHANHDDEQDAREEA